MSEDSLSESESYPKESFKLCLMIHFYKLFIYSILQYCLIIH